MRFLFIIFIIVLISTNLVCAVGFSPSSLVFELEQGEEACKVITLNSDSEIIIVSDGWVENESFEWKINNCNQSADYHGLSIDYDNELSVDEREVNVCLSGENVGEYRGVMLLREEQQGNSVVQIGIWLKATIIEPEPEVVVEPTPAPVPTPSSSGGGGGGGSRTNTIILSEENVTENITQLGSLLEGPEIMETSLEDMSIGEIQEESLEKAEITGAVIGESGKIKIIGIVIAIIVVAGIIITVGYKGRDA